MRETIDLNAAIERRGVGRLAILVIALCFAMMIADGYDFGALSVAAPAIMREWHVQPKEMGGVFSVTFLGLLVGSLFYGWLGDRFGRKIHHHIRHLQFRAAGAAHRLGEQRRGAEAAALSRRRRHGRHRADRLHDGERVRAAAHALDRHRHHPGRLQRRRRGDGRSSRRRWWRAMAGSRFSSSARRRRLRWRWC